MKNFLWALSLLTLVACGDSENSNSDSGNSELLVTNFLKDTRSFERANFNQPVEEFINSASKIADEAVELDKNTMQGFLEKGNTFSHGVIVVGNHTIVKIDDFEKCKTSSSWGGCMPFGEGYIKKGDLIFQKEYINNIIGRPDNQKRMGFLFK